MTTELNELLPAWSGAAQIWIIGTREQVLHLINELTVRGVTSDRARFTPIVPVPFAPGKYMSILER